MLKNVIKNIPGARRMAQTLGLVSPNTSGRQFLLDLLPKHSVGAEIGVHMGDFSQQLMSFAFPKELHLIDPWVHQTSDVYKDAWYGGKAKARQKEMDERYSNVCGKFDQEIQARRVKVHRGNSTDILEQFPDEYFHWIYIDGNHFYEYVKQDLELSLRKTRLGGLITGDDYTEGGWWDSGVKKAVDEFSTNEAVQLIEIQKRQFVFSKEVMQPA